MSQPRLTIRTNFDLAFIDEIISQALPECTMWSDLEITQKEYDTINAKIRERLGIVPSFSALNHLFKQYPAVMVTSLIGFALYEYDDNFWDVWASQFDLSLNAAQSRQIGQSVLAHLKEHDFEVIREEGYA